MAQNLNTVRLYSQLLNTGLQVKDSALYQVIYELIGDIAKLSVSTASSSGGGGGNINPSLFGYWTALTDGDVNETDFIFNNGEPIMIWVPLI